MTLKEVQDYKSLDRQVGVERHETEHLLPALRNIQPLVIAEEMAKAEALMNGAKWLVREVSDGYQVNAKLYAARMNFNRVVMAEAHDEVYKEMIAYESESEK